MDLLRYPRTAHLAGSRLQPGDTSEGQVALESLTGIKVFEEKIDGANSAISFSPDADLLLQSRGHFLTGGAREKQFNLFKIWAQRHVDSLFDLFGQRYVCYGEWCYAKHTVFYDRLPHYFLEFDIFDREQQVFLSTSARQRLLAGSPIVSVPVLATHDRIVRSAELPAMIRPSLYRSDAWLDMLRQTADRSGLDVDLALKQSDLSNLSEGLYLKVEAGDQVIGRYKYVRPDFLQVIAESGSHWASRPIIPNQLVPDVDIFR